MGPKRYQYHPEGVVEVYDTLAASQEYGTTMLVFTP